MRILGVDPGTVFMGYGAIEFRADSYLPITHGRIQIKSKCAFSEKLKQIYESTRSLIRDTDAEAMAVEDVFVSCNARTSLKLGHARGVILLAAAQSNIPISEYAPREIKQAILGRGSATKDQVQWMISQLLKLDRGELNEDSADGLAVALCHGLRSRTAAMIGSIS